VTLENQTIEERKLAFLKPHLLIIRGVPGSGKTSLAKEIQKRLGLESSVVIDPDEIDKQSPNYRSFIEDLKSNSPDIDESIYPYRFLLSRAKKAIELGTTVVWDQPFTVLDGLKYTTGTLTAHAKDLGISLSVIIVELQIPKEEAIKRINKRESEGGHGLTVDQINFFFEKYSTAEGFGFTTLRFETINKSSIELVDEVVLNIGIKK